MPKLITVQMIAHEAARGTGTEDDPVHIVYEWWTPDGETLLLECDPHNDKTAMTMNMVNFLQKIGGSRGA